MLLQLDLLLCLRCLQCVVLRLLLRLLLLLVLVQLHVLLLELQLLQLGLLVERQQLLLLMRGTLRNRLANGGTVRGALRMPQRTAAAASNTIRTTTATR